MLDTKIAKFLKTADEHTQEEAMPYFELMKKAATLRPGSTMYLTDAEEKTLGTHVIYELLCLLNRTAGRATLVVREREQGRAITRRTAGGVSEEAIYNAEIITSRATKRTTV